MAGIDYAAQRSDAEQMTQATLFQTATRTAEMWRGMPEFVQEDAESWHSLVVHFRKSADIAAFGKLIGQTLHEKPVALWYPGVARKQQRDHHYFGLPVTPRYPVYIISKGRSETRLTARALDAMHVPYSIVIEPQEYEQYAAVINPTKILVLPFSNLGRGSIPARNWVWEHSRALGAARHWILDDNIQAFYRLNQNAKHRVESGAIFCAAEDFADRYENIGLCGFNYEMFVYRRRVRPPFLLNTRIYSCILIRNDLPYRWRGRYNEDTDLSLRVLKDGLCTVQFDAFLQRKVATMRMKGGNTEELYAGDGRKLMAESLRDQHPDVTQVVWKFGRWQHHVDYSYFRNNTPILRAGVEIPDGVNNYGMTLAPVTQR
jgi:hypothetical protein